MKKRILIVEDDDDLLEFLSLFLSEKGYEVKTKSNSDNFLESVEDFNPEVILMDVKLPKQSGDNLAESLSDHPSRKDMDIILMSAWDDLEERAERVKADGFLKKPFDLEKLVAIID